MHTPNPSVIHVLKFERWERLDRAERARLGRMLRHAAADGARRATGRPRFGVVRSVLAVLAVRRPGMGTS